MHPYRTPDIQDRRPSKVASGRRAPWLLSTLAVAGAVGWPGLFVAHLLRERAALLLARPEPVPLAAVVDTVQARLPGTSVAVDPVAHAAAPFVLPALEATASVGRRVRAIAAALDHGDLAALATHVSPTGGIRIVQTADLVAAAPRLSAEELRACPSDPQPRAYPQAGTAETCAAYLKRVLGGRSLTATVHVSFEPDGAGERAELHAAFEHAVVVDYGGGGADGARSVTLVMVPEGDDWWLAAIIGDRQQGGDD